MGLFNICYLRGQLLDSLFVALDFGIENVVFMDFFRYFGLNSLFLSIDQFHLDCFQLLFTSLQI